MSNKRSDESTKLKRKIERLPRIVQGRVQKMLRDDTYIPDITTNPAKRERVVHTLREHFMNYHHVIEDARDPKQGPRYPFPQRVRDIKSYERGTRKALTNVSYATFHRLRSATFLTDITDELHDVRLDRADNAMTETISKLSSALGKADYNIIYQNQGIDYVCRIVIAYPKKGSHP